MGFRVFFSVLLLVGLIGAAGALAWAAYGAGVAQGAAGNVAQPPAAPLYYAPYAFHPYGFGFLGCLAPLALLFFGFAFLRMMFWGGPHHWRMRGHWGAMADDWHRRAHGVEKEGTGQGGSPAV
jgi:hypothetical protein